MSPLSVAAVILVLLSARSNPWESPMLWDG